MTTTPAAALAIDASEWFHDPAWRDHVSLRHWRRLAVRSPIAIRAALGRCRELGVRATFFVPASLAANDPALLRELVADGHEVALAGSSPGPLGELEERVRQELLATWANDKQSLESAAGRRVHGFRALFGAGSGTPWWPAELAGLGFGYDATASGAMPVRAVSWTGLTAPLVSFAAWRLDVDQPRLVGLPKAVFAAHYDRVADGDRELASLVRVAGGTVAAALDLSPLQQPVRRLAARPSPALATTLPLRDVPRLAIIVPLKDEEQGIASLVVELDTVAERLGDVVVCEFVFVDDGSTDRTWSLLQAHVGQRPNVRLLQHAENRGVAAAIQTGIRATDAELVASIDGDLSYDPMELRAMLALIEHAEVVTASPYDRRGGVKNVPGWRLFLSRALSRCYRLLLRRPISTWTSCFRLYRRRAVVDLPLAHPGFLGTAELLVRVLRRGGRVAEHPCVLEARLFGFSKLRVLRTIGGHLRLLVQIVCGRIN